MTGGALATAAVVCPVPGVRALISVSKSITRGSTIGVGVGTPLIELLNPLALLVLPRLRLKRIGSFREMAWLRNARNIVNEIPCMSRRENIICSGLVKRPIGIFDELCVLSLLVDFCSVNKSYKIGTKFDTSQSLKKVKN